MRIQSPPGMRDFYPEDMRLQNWLFDAWRRASLAFGFSEYEGPIFEYLDLYTLKSGEGIVSELFTFQDRGQRNFAIRPEMTPTLARMVAARANTLPRPIKWFSIPRMCRAERPQRGRLREFFQWNIDILGVDDPLADAEVIAVAVAFFRDIGLAQDVVMRVNSRPVVSAALATVGIAPEDNEGAFQLIDRHDRLNVDVFRESWDNVYGDRVSADRLTSFLAQTPRTECLELARRAGPDGADAAEQFEILWKRLADLGVQDACEFHLQTVRGLAYYTGSVFEAHARQGGLRALMGGGRYDDLTGLLDGPSVPGVGFGMGDAPVLQLLRALNKLPAVAERLDVYVIDADPDLFDQVLNLVETLRRQGLRVDFSYKRIGVGKQFKQAAARCASHAIVVGHEFRERQELTVKNLQTGKQQPVPANRVQTAARDALHAV
ncbi:MAG: histidine--tRNA ligase [Planctomycetes bacterium]|nr:histidine--tRNA ligase [Planctomycetota bacterium]